MIDDIDAHFMDLYIVLGLSHGATESDIKRAYRRLARRFHPDVNPGDHTAEVRFRQIVEAYETLMDPQRRSRYDSGRRGGHGGRAPRPAGSRDSISPTRGVDHSATFGDLFAEVLSTRGARRSVARARRRSASERAARVRRSVCRNDSDADTHAPRTLPHLCAEVAAPA